MNTAKKSRLRKRPKNLDEIAESLYRATDSEKYLRLVGSLTTEERAEAWRKVDERIAADKARFRLLLENAGR
jgi:hypothetical protein